MELRHAFDQTRRRILPLDKLSLQIPTRHIERVIDATVQIFGFLGSIIVADVDCRDDLYPTETKAPQVLSKQRRFTHIALAFHIPAKPDSALHYKFGRYDRSTIPACIYLEKLVVKILGASLSVGPEEIAGKMPSTILCYLQECFTDYRPCDVNVVEDGATMRPVHTACRGRVLHFLLVNVVAVLECHEDTSKCH